eukprot:TRINITY_DN3621_c0_g3_i1.p1 TRINITY_DN3621_c0_g3~~TRINITY_DN3621_c0_g3_i1.p1  ORF type:complete len:379 (+),score=37.59 TRINITY_DN3621_c0_g3_i1:109-1137(+)
MVASTRKETLTLPKDCAPFSKDCTEVQDAFRSISTQSTFADIPSASSSSDLADSSIPAHPVLCTLCKGCPETRSCSSSLASTKAWFLPQETIMFVDFDDTIFPTAWLQDLSRTTSQPLASMDDLREYDAAAAASVTRLESVAISFLRTAVALAGEVVIVTLGSKNWVESCMKGFFPSLLDELGKLNVTISYAREALSRRKMRAVSLEGMDVHPLLKRAAMRKHIKRFYSQRPKQSWKNCISIGDSVLERDALEELTFTRLQLSQSGKQKAVRCKTVKFHRSPSLDALTSEMELMISCLSALTRYDGDFSYDIQENDAMEVVSLHDLLSQDPCAQVDIQRAIM